MRNEIEIAAPQGYSFKEVRDGKIVFEQDTLPESWEEYCNAHPITAGECFVNLNSGIIPFEVEQDRDSAWHMNVFKSAETAKAFLALNKLIHLRDCYRQGWVPNWRDIQQMKYIIAVFNDEVCKHITHTQQLILSFQTSELRDMFLENFRDLIEQAKELL